MITRDSEKDIFLKEKNIPFFFLAKELRIIVLRYAALLRIQEKRKGYFSFCKYF